MWLCQITLSAEIQRDDHQLSGNSRLIDLDASYSECEEARLEKPEGMRLTPGSSVAAPEHSAAQLVISNGRLHTELRQGRLGLKVWVASHNNNNWAWFTRS